MNKFKANLIFSNDMPLEAFTMDSNGNAYPRSLDMRDLVLETEDQGQTGQCAAYTATSWLESVMWRRTGKPQNYDPLTLYKKAKTIDGMPNEEGTTLNAVMEAIIDLGWGNGLRKSDICNITSVNGLKRAIHRYGTCLLGFSITSGWYAHVGKLVMERAGGTIEGGHAVICTGYNDIGVFIQNSWGESWGKYGFACIPWNVFTNQFRCGTYFKNCLNNIE